MPESQEVWNALFPGRARVQWKAFVITFEKYFKANFPAAYWTSIKTERLLKYAVALEDSFVTDKTFENFIKLFGPIQMCLVKIRSNLFDDVGFLHPWYHGPLTREQSSSLLSHVGVGSFLVRLSEHKAGNFTIAYVSENGSLKNVLVHNHMQAGYGLDANCNGKKDGRSFANLPEFLSLHPLKLRHPLASTLYETCHAEGPALCSAPTIPTDAVDAVPTVVSFPVSDEDPYGTFGEGLAMAKCGSSSSTYVQPSTSPLSQSRNVAGGVSFNGSGSWGGGGVSNFASSGGVATADASVEDCYGSFDDEASFHTSPALTFSQSEVVVGRNISDQAVYGGSFGLPDRATRALSAQPWGRQTSEMRGHSSLPRSELNNRLDESCHCEREGKLDTALEIANNVYDTVRSYVHNIQELQRGGSAGSGLTELSSTSSGESLSSVPTDDLGLLAKTLQQRGDIQKAMAADVEAYLLSYEESHEIMKTIRERADRSDRGSFTDFQSFSRLHRQLAKIYLEQKNCTKAVYHFSEELAMFLLDSDFSSREMTVSFISQMRYTLESYSTAAREDSLHFCEMVSEVNAKDLLDRGISEFNKGPASYAASYDLLTKALRCSRCCGDEMIELRALGNIATVESSRGNDFEAVQFYSQCAILCKKVHKDNSTLKKILFKKVLCMMKVGLYNKAIVCINQLMAIATSLQNIEKLEELKSKAMAKLAVLGR